MSLPVPARFWQLHSRLWVPPNPKRAPRKESFAWPTCRSQAPRSPAAPAPSCHWSWSYAPAAAKDKRPPAWLTALPDCEASFKREEGGGFWKSPPSRGALQPLITVGEARKLRFL